MREPLLVLWMCVSVIALLPGCSKTTAIPAEGGSVFVEAASGGSASLKIPPGRARAVAGSARPSGVIGASEIFTFEPSGETFDPPAELTIKLSEAVKVDLNTVYIATRQHASSEWKRLESNSVDVILRTVTAQVRHFSEFIVLSDGPATAGVGDQFSVGGVQLSTSAEIRMSIIADAVYTHAHVESAPPTTAYRMGGLFPNHDYYIYRDTFIEPPIVVKSSVLGEVSFSIENEGPYDLFVKAQHSTAYFPRDCEIYGGTNIFADDGATKIGCRLAQDVVGTIEITDRYCELIDGPFCLRYYNDKETAIGYVLDCNDHTIIGDGFASPGLLLSGPAASASNCAIQGFHVGIDFTGFFPAYASGSVLDQVFIRSPANRGIQTQYPLGIAIRRSTIESTTATNTNYSILANNEDNPNWEVSGGSVLHGSATFLGHVRTSVIEASTLGAIQMQVSGSGLTTGFTIRNNILGTGDRIGASAISLSSTVTLTNISINGNQINTGERDGIAASNVATLLVQRNQIGAGGAKTGIRLSGVSNATIELNRIVGNAVGIELFQVGSRSLRLNDIFNNSLNLITDVPFDLGGAQGNFWGIRCIRSDNFYGPLAVLGGPVTDSAPWGVEVAFDTPGRPPASAIIAAGAPGCTVLDTDGDGASPSQGDCDDTRADCTPATCVDGDGDHVPRCRDCNDTSPICTTDCAGLTARHLFQLTGP